MKRTELAAEMKGAAQEIAASAMITGLNETEAAILGAMIEHGSYAAAAADLRDRALPFTDSEEFKRRGADIVRGAFYLLAKRAEVAVPFIPKPRKPKVQKGPQNRWTKWAIEILDRMVPGLAKLRGRER